MIIEFLVHKPDRIHISHIFVNESQVYGTTGVIQTRLENFMTWEFDEVVVRDDNGLELLKINKEQVKHIAGILKELDLLHIGDNNEDKVKAKE